MYMLYPLPNPTLAENPLETMSRWQQSWLDNGLGFVGYWQAWLQDAQTLQSVLLGEYVGWCERFAPFSLPLGVADPFLQVEPVATLPEAAEVISAVDDLTRIQGIGKVLQERLNAAGIRCFQQIVDWDANDIAQVEEEVLGSRFSGRVERDQWQLQAEALLQG
ncbi:MAG: hypothetical protein KDI68_09925 [Gammaproteobacteria bacterium]|nr:hypothetical protein [Gammaproteobacteria bacterium]